MMRIRLIISFVLLASCGTTLSNEEKPDAGKTAASHPPGSVATFAVGTVNRGNLLVFRSKSSMRDVKKTVVATVPVTKIVDGKEVVKQVEEQRVVVEKVPLRIQFAHSFRGDGLVFEAVDCTEFSLEQATILMKTPTAVLLASSDFKLEPYLREVLKRKTIIVRIPNFMPKRLRQSETAFTEIDRSNKFA